MIYGYIRRDELRRLTDQETELRKWHCDVIFIEESSLQIEVELAVLVRQLTAEDTIVVQSLSAFGKRLHQLTKILIDFNLKSVRLISILEGIDTQKNREFFDNCQAIFEMDSYCRSELTKQSLDRARQEGQILGRPRISPDIEEKIKHLHFHHQLSIRAIADRCQVSIGTVHKYISLL